jgi:glycosyltransferase involved in cell wall biosynthesis
MTFSVIICTYNPENQIFCKLISAIAALQNPEKSSYEIIIVDNNSKSPTGEKKEVKELAAASTNVAVIVEKKPGLTSARLAGAHKAIGDWLIFFDDDNEPSQSYLLNLEKLVLAYPQVGCWGPGVVDVQYVGQNVHPWFNKNRRLFQEKKSTELEFASAADWLDCYPFGTGLCIKKEIVDAYKENLVAGRYTLTDRIGKKLVSGGDTQLVLQAVKLGYAAGTSPTLQLNHLIAEKKLKFKYMLQQSYMTASCYVRAFNEISFTNKVIELDFPGNTDILRLVYSTFKNHGLKKPVRDVLILLYSRIGEVNARYFAANVERRPLVLNLMERLISA